MVFIGIDLAWTYKNESGLCVIKDSGEVLRHEAAVFSNAAIVDLILSYSSEEVCVGIDAAIIVNNVSGSRAAEGLMMRDQFHGHRLQAFNSNRQYLEKVFGDIRGEEIYRALRERTTGVRVTDVFGQGQLRLMEVFPTGVVLGMLPELYPLKYKLKGKVPFEASKHQMTRLLQGIDVIRAKEEIWGDVHVMTYKDVENLNKSQYKHFEDQIDAFLCAYGMLAVYRGIAKQRIYGDEMDGFIMVPVLRED